MQRTAEVGSIHHVDGEIGLLVDQEVARHPFFERERGQAVGAWQVDGLDFAEFVTIDAVLLVNRYARVVGDMLSCAGKHIEQRGFSCILLTG